MIHIESKTGRSYPVYSMSDSHLQNTVELYINRCEQLNKTADNNPRYMKDFDNNMCRLSTYYIEISMRGIINPLTQQRLEKVYDERKRIGAEVYLP